MPAIASPQVKAPFPSGPQNLGTCPTCGPAEWLISYGDAQTNITRSQDPGPDGRYEVHPHHEWCPVLTGETPEVACPACGAPVMEYDYSPGVIVTVPHAGPNGMDGHLLGAMDEIHDMPFGTFGTTRKLAPEFDRVTVRPCGDELRGREAHVVLTAAAEASKRKADVEADAEIAKHAELLAAIDAVGMPQLAERYRAAVRSGSSEASGLLAAMRTLVDTL